MKKLLNLRVLIGKPGFDTHDRGAKILAVSLRNHGCEVIYTGIHQTPEAIVKSAVEEDVDVLLLSILSGAHLPLTARVMELLKEQNCHDLPVLVGGIIPDQDFAALKEMGVREIFRPMTPIEECIKYLAENVASTR